MTEQCTAGCASNGNIPGLTYRSQDGSSIWNAGYVWRGSASFVTGAHSMKFGYQGGLLTNDRTGYTNSNYLAYRVNNGVPNQLTMSGIPFLNEDRTRYFALYAQEQWTFGRWTLQGAVRYDNAWSYTPDLQVGPNKLIPNALFFPAEDLVNWKDITPKAGVAWDVMGNGKTAVRVNIGKYLDPARAGGTYSGPNPVSRISTTVTRTWTDGNRNWIPDCDLLNPAAQDFRAERRRLLCGDVECELRKAGLQQHLRSRAADGLGTPSRRLELRRVGPARDRPARLDGSRLLPALVGQHDRDRQSRGGGIGLLAVQRDGAFRSAAARRRRQHPLRALRRRAGQVRADRQLHYPGAQLRQSARALRRGGRHRQRAAAWGPDVSRGHQYGARGDGQLRDQGAASRDWAAQSLLSRRARVPHAVQGPRRVHHPEGGRPVQRHVPVGGRAPAPGELRGAERPHRAVARPEPLRQVPRTPR